MNPARVVMYDKFASYSTFDCAARYTLLTWATELGSFVSVVVFPHLLLTMSRRSSSCMRHAPVHLRPGLGSAINARESVDHVIAISL